MFPFDKPLSEATEADLALLVSARALESRDLEFKLTLPDATSAAKKEFLADVSSFANAAGGVILYGAKARPDGSAESMPGLSFGNIDGERLRLEAMIRTGLDPRIASVIVHPICQTASTYVIAVGIPRSFAGPHMVRESSKFFTRNGGGKQPLDTAAELRAAFLGAEAATDRIRQFHTERLARIIANDTFLPVVNESRLALHLFPLTALTTGNPRDLKPFVDAHAEKSLPLLDDYKANLTNRYTFDGFMRYTPLSTQEGNESSVTGYVELSRTGWIEAVSGTMVQNSPEGRPIIKPASLEGKIIQALEHYLRAENLLEFDPPFYVLLSLINARGVVLSSGQLWEKRVLNRDHLLFPEIVVEDKTPDVARLLKPTLDMLWNAWGYERCFSYDGQGNWHPTHY